MNPAEEKALKALNDVTEELRLMQELTCETSEEEQVRASEIEKLVASVEEIKKTLPESNDLQQHLQKLSLLSRRSQRLVWSDPRQKRKPKFVLPTRRSCTDALKATTKGRMLLADTSRASQAFSLVLLLHTHKHL